MISIGVINDPESFSEIKRDWQSLEKKRSQQNITSSFYWCENWWEIFKNLNNNIFGLNKKIRIVVLKKDNEVKAIFPLVKLYRSFAGFKFSFLEFLGQQWGGHSNDLISFNIDSEDIISLLNWIKNNIKYDYLFLKYLPSGSILSSHFRMYEYTACPTIKLEDYKNYEEYKRKNYSKNLKRNFKKVYNKAKKRDVDIKRSIEKISPTILDEIKRLSLQKTRDGKRSIYEHTEKQKCYNRAYRKYESHASLIMLNNAYVSYITGIVINGKKYCIDTSYDRDYKEYDLGMLNIDQGIRDSFEKGLEVHSLGPGLETYKFKFTKQIEKLYMVGSSGNTIKSIILNPYFRYLLKKRENEFQKELQKINL